MTAPTLDGFAFGPTRIAAVFEPMLHPAVRALEFDAVPGVDCGDCRMVNLGLFSEPVKCCTYVPALPNFLVGEILAAGQSSGSPDTVDGWVRAGRGDPLYVYAPPRLEQLHRQAALNPRNALACPLLASDGRCTIYAQRPYLCVGYHCAYPNPATKTFWNCMSSLLALHSAIAAQHLMEVSSVDRGLFIDTWDSATDPTTIWTDGDGLNPDLSAQLWQGETDPARFYDWCFRYILDRRREIRGELDRFRRGQLVRYLGGRGQLTDVRRAEIEDQPSDPAPREPPADAHRAFEDGIVVFGNHRWTVPEHESFLLWYFDAMT